MKALFHSRKEAKPKKAPKGSDAADAIGTIYGALVISVSHNPSLKDDFSRLQSLDMQLRLLATV